MAKKSDQEEKDTEVKRNWTFYSILGVIADILIYPVIIVSLICCIVMFSAKKQGKVPSFVGYSLVQVTSGSMKKDGFLVRDSVFVKRVDTDTLRPDADESNFDSIIAFYHYDTGTDKNVAGKTLITDFDNLPYEDSDTIDYSGGRVTLKTVYEKKAKVYFHRVIGIYMDEDGIRYFKTKGSSNSSADSYLVREDLVAGKYINTPVWIRNVFSFCNSSLGMILMVVIPLSILILFQSLSIIEQVNNIILEKKIINGEEYWNTEDAWKANIGFEMDLPSQVYFYAKSKPTERKELFDFLWGEIAKSEKQKNKELYSNCLVASKMLEKNPNTYWGFWDKKITGKRNRRIFNQYKEFYEQTSKISNISQSIKR